MVIINANYIKNICFKSCSGKINNEIYLEASNLKCNGGTDHLGLWWHGSSWPIPKFTMQEISETVESSFLQSLHLKIEAYGRFILPICK